MKGLAVSNPDNHGNTLSYLCMWKRLLREIYLGLLPFTQPKITHTHTHTHTYTHTHTHINGLFQTVPTLRTSQGDDVCFGYTAQGVI